jgi:hypothetical protein
MRTHWLGTVIVCAAVVGVVRSQAPLPITPIAPSPRTPPLVLPRNSEGVPDGTTVSRPLQPVAPTEIPPEVPPESQPNPPVVTEAVPEGKNPLGQSWDALEFLLWWGKPLPLPPLVTGSRAAAIPILGGPNTVLLAGGRPIDSQSIGGMRYNFGWAVNEAKTAGIEVTYLFLGTRSTTAAYSDLIGDRYPSLGRPFVNAATGKEDVIPVAFPGVGDGLVTVSTASRVTGWEVGGVGSLYSGPGARLNVSAGYRYFMANEGLRIEQTTLRFPLPNGAPPILASMADQIDAHNRFHGGQVGLHADLSRGVLFLQIVGKIAIGQSIEVARVSGQSYVVTGGSPLPLIQTYNAAVLGLPSNSGRLSQSVFAVLPEAQIKIGCKLGEYGQFYVGYNFLLLSDAIRAGDQVDRTLSPGPVPVLPQPSTALAADRPLLALTRGDFWVQGLVFGMEWRY